MKLLILALFVVQVFAKKHIPKEPETLGNPQKRIIMPGTLWCGNGNKAKSYDDLGRLADLDSCCRDHDHCDRTVSAFSTDYGYENELSTTVSDCKCDKKFYKCMKAVKDSWKSAFTVGKLYFNYLKMPCLEFNEDGTKATRGHSPKY
eukprot:gene3163-1467_t